MNEIHNAMSEVRKGFEVAGISLNTVSKLTRIPRKRIARIFNGGIPREEELVKISKLTVKYWERKQ